MIETVSVDESLIQRLPLPLVKLVRRAQNAKTPLDRHQDAYYLWEAALKLLGSVAVVEFAELGDHDPQLVAMLENLARPAVGHWWQFVRRLVPVLAGSGDEGFSRIGDLVLGRARDDLPRAAGLDAALIEHQQGKASARATVRLTELFDRLVAYRNQEIGHGAAGQRPGRFYDRMARALLGGVVEILGQLDVLAGRRLIYVGDVRRQSSGDWLVERYELIGESARRIESLQVAEGDERALPYSERTYIERPASAPRSGRPALLGLSPLIHFQLESEQVFFLSARRGQRQAEYLCYHDGEQLKRDLGNEQRELLARVLRMNVDVAAVAAWTARSQAEEPAGEGAAEPEPAERTIGEFELLSRLGQGGMGVVYRAWQPSLGRQVALKCLLKSGDPKAEARFAREIRALGRVEHPAVVKVFTSGSEADQWFFAMELVEGTDLAKVCEQLSGRKVTEVDDTTWREALTSACAAARSSEVPLSGSGRAAERLARARTATEEAGEEGSEAVTTAVRSPGYVAEVVEIVRRVAEAADALHEAGIVHRDIKPGNIMVARDRKAPVLMDLGLAQLADEAEGRLTRTRQFVGTLRYASPEQVLAATRVDRRSDVYSLGATLWELLTLRPLFGATDLTPTPELMQTILVTEPASPRRYNPAVARDLEAIVLKCLEKDKTRRYATAGELAADLGRFLRDEPVTARLSSPWELTVKWTRRRPAIAALGAALFMVGLIGIAGVFWEWRTAEANAKRAKDQEQKAILARNEAKDQEQKAILARNEAKDQEQKAILARNEAKDQEQKAILSRNEAKDQEQKAILARDDAERQRNIVRNRSYIEHMNLAQREWKDAHVDRVLELLEGERPTQGQTDLRGFEWYYLNRLAHSDLMTIKGNRGLTSVAFSPDGRRIASGSADQTIKVWDAATGQETLTLKGHTGHVMGVAFSPDGRRIASGSADQTIKVWDAATGQVRLTLDWPITTVGPVAGHMAFSPDGRRIASTDTQSSAVKVWDAGSGQETLAINAGTSAVTGVAFSPDGRRIAIGHIIGPVKLWDSGTGQEALTLEGLTTGALGVAFSPDGRRIATGQTDGTVKVWDAGTGQEALTLRGHTEGVFAVAFSPDGRRIASAGADQTIKVWDSATGQERLTHKGHRGGIGKVAFSPDGRRIASVGMDRTIKVWDAGTGQETLTLKGQITIVDGVAFGPDGRRIASASRDGTVNVWDADTGLQTLTLKEQTELVDGVAFNGVRNVWSTSALKRVAFSPDGRRIASGSRDGTVRDGTVNVWDAGTGLQTLTLKGHTLPVYGVAFSPDGRRIASASQDKTVKVWDADTGHETLTLEGHTGFVNDVAFSPDGRRIASASYDETIKVWDTGSGRETLTLKGHALPVRGVAFSPDGRRIASAGWDRTVKVWDAGSGQETLTLKGHTNYVLGVAFSPDSRRIASASWDQTLKLWDADTGQETLTLKGHTGPVTSVAFSPDGRRIASASYDHTVKIWDARDK